MVSDDPVTRTREAHAQSFQVLVEALVAKGFEPQAAKNFVIKHDHMISNLAVHDAKEMSERDHT